MIRSLSHFRKWPEGLLFRGPRIVACATLLAGVLLFPAQAMADKYFGTPGSESMYLGEEGPPDQPKAIEFGNPPAPKEDRGGQEQGDPYLNFTPEVWVPWYPPQNNRPGVRPPSWNGNPPYPQRPPMPRPPLWQDSPSPPPGVNPLPRPPLWQDGPSRPPGVNPLPRPPLWQDTPSRPPYPKPGSPYPPEFYQERPKPSLPSSRPPDSGRPPQFTGRPPEYNQRPPQWGVGPSNRPNIAPPRPGIQPQPPTPGGNPPQWGVGPSNRPQNIPAPQPR